VILWRICVFVRGHGVCSNKPCGETGVVFQLKWHCCTQIRVDAYPCHTHTHLQVHKLTITHTHTSITCITQTYTQKALQSHTHRPTDTYHLAATPHTHTHTAARITQQYAVLTNPADKTPSLSIALSNRS